MRRTALATIPLCAIRFAISPPMIAVRRFGMIIVYQFPIVPLSCTGGLWRWLPMKLPHPGKIDEPEVDLRSYTVQKREQRHAENQVFPINRNKICRHSDP